MKFGPKYKIARRLGALVFDKTQTQKFALREKTGKPMNKKPKMKSGFAMQLLEKQKAKVTYGIDERKFKNYVTGILSKRGENNEDSLVKKLEMRLDNAVYRLGLANTRQFSRQMVNHGHINVNGKRNSIPSFEVSVGDVITVRERSLGKNLFKDFEERMKSYNCPSWLAFDKAKKEGKVQGLPKLAPAEIGFDVASIYEFYSR
jgi:small subunit ribosomal protein S4